MTPSCPSRLIVSWRLLALLALSVPVAHALTGCDSTEESACGDVPSQPTLELCLSPGEGSGGASGAGASGSAGAPVCAASQDAENVLNRKSVSGDQYRVRSEAAVKDGQCCYQARRVYLCD